MDSQLLVALALSLVGGLSTSIGALIVIVNQAPNLKMLGLLQGFAAGLMLSISFLDLAHNAINSIGFLKANLWFFGGVVFFAIVAKFIPEPTVVPGSDVKSKKTKGDGGKDTMKKHRRKVFFGGIITAIAWHKLAQFSRGHGSVSWLNEAMDMVDDFAEMFLKA